MKFSAPLVAANLKVRRRAERDAKGRLNSRTALEAAFVALRQATSLEGWRIQATRGRENHGT